MTKKSKVITLIASAIAFATIMVFSLHYWGYKTMSPQSWKEIWETKWLILFSSIIFGVGCVYIIDNEVNKKKEEEQNRK